MTKRQELIVEMIKENPGITFGSITFKFRESEEGKKLRQESIGKIVSRTLKGLQSDEKIVKGVAPSGIIRYYTNIDLPRLDGTCQLPIRQPRNP